MSGELQEGIFWQRDARPGGHFKILFLRTRHRLTAADLHTHLSALWVIWQDLKRGVVRELGEAVTVPGSGLRVLLGFGGKLFRLDGVRQPLPEALGPKSHFLSPRASGGGRLLPGGGLSYDPDISDNPATEELVVQFIADTPLAVHRAQVETWRYLSAHIDPDSLSPPLEITGFFDGFHREDRRSWLGFHDGISNLQKGEQRRSVIAIKPETAGEDQWTVGGSYLVFMRLPVDLPAWDALSEPRQELLVGRKKVTGCPLQGAAGGEGIPVPGCPASGSIIRADGTVDPDFREPPGAVDAVIAVSHVKRANHSPNLPDRVESRRIYRQGYEFLAPAPGGMRVGLNFVSFQDHPERCLFVLQNREWLGRINFGGREEEQTGGLGALISVRAAGVYLVPPVAAGEAFPGASVLKALSIA